MSLQDIVRGAHAVISGSLATDSAVTVKYDGETATGIRAVTVQGTDSSELGELGLDTNIVRVPAGTISQPARGKTFLVDDEKVTCVNSRLDPVGACYLIEFTYQQNAMD
jgi:hypothetical protein